MIQRIQNFRVRPAWWTAILVVVLGAFTGLCSALFTGTLKTYVPVTVTSERSGLVMESGAKVKLRGVQVGRVAGVEGGRDSVRLKLELFPDQIDHIPANVQAEIRATTVFGSKYVDLIYPEQPSAQHISAGTVVNSRNVSTEVNTVFESLVGVLRQIDPPKLNAVLTAVGDAVRGRGDQIGAATTAANRVLAAVNPRMTTLRDDWHALAGAGGAYGDAAQHILGILDAASTTSATLTRQSSDLNELLLNTIGFTESGIQLIGPVESNLVRAVTALRPTTDLLAEYDPEYTCLLQGAKWTLDNGAYQAAGGDGRTIVIDDAFLFGDDPYRYPDNLPIVAARGGPGGKPGCGSLPIVSRNYPVRDLVTNTGWGTGLDIRPNPGIGHPWWVNYFPVTRAVPEPPTVHGVRPPAIGPVPYPGAPPYGAPLYAPDGSPLYPPPPGVPPPLPPPGPPAAPGDSQP
jgi:phospholipid/cholesterol/gamma-HCH transport system substrate-binding protein